MADIPQIVNPKPVDSNSRVSVDPTVSTRSNKERPWLTRLNIAVSTPRYNVSR